MFFASWFTTLFVQPVFNLLTFIYAIIPGHNFGVALILFTLLVRYLMYPLLRKQLYHTKAMREMQPELKRIKKEAAGDRQKESVMMMELYKERQINPLAPIGLMAVQIPLLLALFSGLHRIVVNPHEVIDFSYSFIRDMSAMKQLAGDIKLFDNTLLGFIDLSRSAIGTNGIYIPAMLLVIGSSVTQFLQIRQTSPADKDTRKLRQILKDAGKGATADQAEVNAAMGRNMSYVFPVLIFFLTVSFAAALSLYWFVGGLIAYLQQAYLLKKDQENMMGADAAGAPSKAKARVAKSEPVEAEIIQDTPSAKAKTPNKKSAPKRKKRR